MSMTQFFIALSLVAFSISIIFAAPQPADTVAINGRIYTVNPDQPWAEAVAVRGSDIVYVGNNAGAQAFVGPDTYVGDLRGKFVMPGIISTHEHPLMVMALSSGLTLEYTEDADQMLTSVKEYVENHPDAPMFSFGGSFEGRVEIYRQDLDKIIADKPFLMIAASGHGGWCNSKALEVAGITKDTPDPIDSFQREPDGTPNGYLESSASTLWMLNKLGVITRQAATEYAKATLAELSRYGITALLDNGAPYVEDTLYPVIAGLEDHNELNIRISACPIAQRVVMLDHTFGMLQKYSKINNSEMFKVITLKIHGDGSPDGWTAGLLEPYADRPDSTGLTSFTPEAQATATMKAAQLGFDITTHAIGDRTMRQTLDAYEAVRKAGYTELRLGTGHSSLIHPDDVPRLKQLNVIVNTYATKNAVPDPTWEARLGPERAKHYQPMGTLLDTGIMITMSADYPTAPVNPWLQISIAMTRHEPGKGPEFHGLEEDKLTLEQAIRAYTIDAAYHLRWSDIIGSIEAGKRADMIVLDRNPFNSTTDEIAEINVLATMMNGRIIHEEAVNWDPPGETIQFDVCGSPERTHEHQSDVPSPVDLARLSDKNKVQLIDRLLTVIESDIVPLTQQGVRKGNKLFGGAVIRKSNLSTVVAVTNTETGNPLLHGEITAIHAFYDIPRDQRPPAKDCIFICTHEPCPLCLSGITWAGFDNFFYLFSYEDTKDAFNIPHDLHMHKEIFRLEDGNYAQKNDYWSSWNINDLIESCNEPDRKQFTARVEALRKTYDQMSQIYQESKDQGTEIPLK